MTGLEKIVKAIEDEANANANAVIAEAEKEAEDIITAAKAEAEKQYLEIAKKSEAEVKAANSRADSAAQLQEKKLILKAKQQMIQNVIVNARESLLKLPDSEYITVLLKMVKKYALNKTGRMIVSPKDKKRLPNDFDKKIKDALSDKKGAELVIAEETRELDGGFVLVYGDVEENCSFEALFFAAKEELQDKISTLLFE